MNFFLTRRFWPLFTAQFFGAANDNFLKNALLMMIVFQSQSSDERAGAISNTAAALFILPYFLFSALAGQLADKYDKASYIRVVKFVEILLMVAASIGFWLRSEAMLLAVLFFMGTQSAFFSPAKFAVLPVHLREHELLAGNAWIGGGTYLAILLGAMSGGVVIALPGGALWCGALLTVCAVLGFLACRAIPPAPPDDAKLKLRWNIVRETILILRDDVWRQKTVRHCVLSSSFFWLAGSFYVTQMPLFAKKFLGGDEIACTVLFVLFSVGVGIGAMTVNFLFKRRIDPGLLIVSAVLVMMLVTVDLAFLARESAVTEGQWHQRFNFYRTSLDVFLFALCGGIWSVPLQARIQQSSERGVLARVIAGGNISDAFAMALGAVAAGILLKAGVRLPTLFFGLAVMLLFVALHARTIRWKHHRRMRP